MITEQTVKDFKTKDLLRLFFEKAQRSMLDDLSMCSLKLDKDNNIAPGRLSPDEETEMYIMYEELQLRAGEYDRMKK